MSTCILEDHKESVPSLLVHAEALVTHAPTVVDAGFLEGGSRHSIARETREKSHPLLIKTTPIFVVLERDSLPYLSIDLFLIETSGKAC